MPIDLERKTRPLYRQLSGVLLDIGDPAFAHMPNGLASGGRVEVVPLITAADLGIASSSRSDDDYELDWRLSRDFTYRERASRRVVPANIDRRLISQDMVNMLQQRTEGLEPLGVSGFKIINIIHNLYGPSPHTRFRPVELAISYAYKNASGQTINIAGSPVISALHRLTEISALDRDPDLRTKIIEHHLKDYQERLPGHNVSVIAMPPRDEGSPTHRAFAQLAIPHPLTGAIVQQAFFGDRLVDIYYLAHGTNGELKENTRKTQELMMDETHRTQILPALDNAWQENFLACRSSRLPDADRKLAAGQVSDIAKILFYDYCDRSCPQHIPGDPQAESRQKLDLGKARDF